MKFPKSLEELIDCFKLLPGIGEKNAERLSFAVLKFSDENAKKFSTAINNVKTKIVKCERCNNLTEDSSLEGTDVTVTKIAAGIPVGADMEYLDSLTIQRALEGRNKVS